MARTAYIQQNELELQVIVEEEIIIKKTLEELNLPNNAEGINQLKERIQSKFEKSGFPFVSITLEANGKKFVASVKTKIGEENIPPELKPLVEQNKSYKGISNINIYDFSPENKIITTLSEKYPLKNQFGYENALSVEIKELEKLDKTTYLSQVYNLSGLVKEIQDGEEKKLNLISSINVSKKQLETEEGQKIITKYIEKINKVFNINGRLGQDREGNYQISIFIKLDKDQMAQYKDKVIQASFRKFFPKSIKKIINNEERYVLEISGMPNKVALIERKEKKQEVEEQKTESQEQIVQKEEQKVEKKQSNVKVKNLPF